MAFASPGTIVLVQWGEQLWPAQVVDASELQQVPRDGYLWVRFFTPEAEGAEVDALSVQPFDPSVADSVSDPALLAAMVLATDAYNEQQQAAQPPATSDHVETTAVPRRRNAPPARKRNRDVAAELTKQGEDEPVETLSDTELAEQRRRLREAVSNDDVAAVTTVLLALAKVRVSLEQLRSTKIGVEVCNLRLNGVFESRWKLVDGIVQWWANELPDTTKKAWTLWRDMRHTNPEIGTNSSAQPATGAQAPRDLRALNFHERLAAVLLREDELQELGVSREAGEEVVREIVSLCGSRERKDVALSALDKAGNTILRGQLLTGAIAPKTLFDMTDHERLTPQERDALSQQLDQKIRDKEESAASMQGNVTEMYECGRCGKRRCRYFTMQTRSADEPETVFVTCLECEYAWSIRGD